MLEAIGLACERGDVRLFSKLSFTLGAGELLAVQGPNGSGKTSLLRLLAGLARPAAGRILWRDEEIGELGESYSGELLFIGHANAVKDEFSAEENLVVAQKLAGRTSTAAERAEALRQIGLGSRSHLPARYLSQGQKRRAALARLWLAADVPLWILDEPFAALDVRALETVVDLIGAHIAGGGSAVLTTHQEVEITRGTRRTVTLGA